MRRRSLPFILGFLAPAALLYGGLVLWPLIQTFRLSLYSFTGLSIKMKPVGFKNFEKVANDEIYRQTLANGLWMLVAAGIVLIAGGVALAHLSLDQNRTAKFLRATILIPQIMSLVVVAIVWMFLLNPSFGPADALVRAIGLEPPKSGWLGDTATALPSVTAAFVWYALGFYALLFTAGLRQIPEEINEAAELDGARGWFRFRRITWPLLWSVKRIAVTYVVINVMNVFALVQIMTNGGPDRRSESQLTYLFEQGFKNSQFGYAASIASVNFLLAMILSLAVLAWFRKSPEAGRR